MIQNCNGKLAYFIAWQDNKPVHILSTMKSDFANVIDEFKTKIANDGKD